jgi:amidophosphoribosyltransferase
LAYLALYALQHRGQESAGIVTAERGQMTRRAGMGHVADVFSRELLEQLPGEAAIGHVRYSTSGDSSPANAQPFLMRHHRGPIAIAHNGNLVNAGLLRGELEAEGSIFQTNSDTETVLHLAAKAKAPDVVDALVESLVQMRGAFSLVALVPGRMIAARDPLGWRPLSIGRIGGAWVIASETCAFDLLGAEYIRDLIQGASARCRRHRSGPGFGPVRGTGLLARLGDPLRARHGPQPLRRPDLHRALPADTELRREDQAEPREGHPSRQEDRAG